MRSGTGTGESGPWLARSIRPRGGPTDFYRYALFTDPSTSFTGAWTNQREAFIVGNDGRATYILHGK